MKKLLLILFSSFCLLTIRHANASHLTGGEITWECLTSGPDAGKFVFHMSIYRDCAGVAAPTTATIDAGGGCPVSSIPMNFVSLVDITPVCDPTGCSGQTALSCGSASFGTVGANQQAIFASNPITINGVPPSTGWVFTYSNCCRNSCVMNVNTASSYTLRAIMYPYNNQNTNPCFDSSPRFMEKPSMAICSGPFKYNDNGADYDMDSLFFSWGQPLDSYSGGFNYCTFTTGYSLNNQLPGSPTLNSSTGEVTLNSAITGCFVTCMRVQSYKCGILVAEIFREIQTTLISCPLAYPGSPVNSAPIVNKPFNNGTSNDTTVYAGDSVCFNILAEDYDEKCALVFQSVTLQASGSQFGTGFTSSTSGCLFPPCATLNPPPGDSLVTHVLSVISSRFCWKTDCSHIYNDSTCNPDSSAYLFTIKAFDDYCPIPGLNQMTVKITVMDRPTIPASSLRCTEVLPNGDVKLSWVPVTESPGIFNGYEIWRYDSVNSTYTHLTTLSDSLNTNSYIDTTANADTIPLLYYVKTVSGCHQVAVSNMIATMSLFAYSNDGVTATLAWNAISDPLLPSNTGMYKIYKYYNGIWTLIDSVYNVTDSLLHYIDLGADSLPLDSVKYRVEVDDASGCTSVSRVTEVYIDNTGINENNVSFTAKLFPNPAKNSINLEVKNLKSEQIEISIKNQLGQTIQQEMLKPRDGIANKQIQIGHLNQGIYYINLKSEGYSQNLKFIKL